MKQLQFIFLSAFLILLTNSCTENDTTQKDEIVDQWIRTTVDSVIAENNVRAFSIAISRDGKPADFQFFGAVKSDSTVEVNEFSIFPISFLSKTFTGIIVNNLVEEGKLNYDEPLSTYLSDVLTDKALDSFENISFKNLLNHRSGISDSDCSFYKSQTGEEVFINRYTPDQLVQDLNKISVDPEDRSFEYSNFGYAIIGYICERVSGQSYDELLKEYITDQHDLPNTEVHLSEERKRSILSSYQTGDGQSEAVPVKQDIAPAADGVYSNLVDLSYLQRIQIKSYQNYFERGIKNPLILTERSVETRIYNWKYGIGFMLISNINDKYFGYYRNTKGYSSVYLFSAYPNVGMTVLTTNGGPWLRELALGVMDALVDEKRMLIPQKRSLAWTLFSIIDSDGIEYGKDWFQKNKVSKKYTLVESDMNTVGYRLLRLEKVKESIEVFKLNVAEYPESSNVYDSLGEAYAADDNKELAIENYQKSLDMNPKNSRAKRVLKQLRSEE